MRSKSQPRVLIIDDDPQVGADLLEMLTPRHCTVEVVSGAAAHISSMAESHARRFRPHVVILDLRLLDHHRDERSGLRLLGKLLSARCIIYSSYLSVDVTREASKRYGVNDYVSKGEAPEKLVELVSHAARSSCAARTRHTIRWPQNWDPSEMAILISHSRQGPPPPEILEDIVAQLFPDHKEVALEPILRGDAGASAVSRGHSAVLKAQLNGLEAFVVKLAPAEEVCKEAENYHKYVEDRLGGRFHAQLGKSVEFWDLGGTSYRFIGSRKGSLPSLSDLYRRASVPEAILSPLRHFFLEVWSRHYRECSEGNTASLFELYDSVFHLRKRLEKRKFNREVAEFLGRSTLLLTNPVAWLVERADKEQVPIVRRAVTHGDLHGDNLFVDGEHAWAIDFERTGPGHILRDFVELEADIVTRLVPFSNEKPELVYNFARAIAAPERLGSPPLPDARLPESAEIHKALHVVAGLRALAHELTHVEDTREYLWGLLCDAVFVASLAAEGTVQRERALVLGSAVCERLS